MPSHQRMQMVVGVVVAAIAMVTISRLLVETSDAGRTSAGTGARLDHSRPTAQDVSSPRAFHEADSTAPGRVTGRVSDRRNEPLAGITVALVYEVPPPRHSVGESDPGDRHVAPPPPPPPVTPDFAPPGLRTTTDASGRYAIDSVPPGCFVLVATSHDGGADVACRFVNPVIVRGAETTVIDVVAAADLVLEGRVVDPLGNPVPDAEVDVRERLLGNPRGVSGPELVGIVSMLDVDEAGRAQTEITQRLVVVPTDQDGKFRVGGLCAGGKLVLVRKPEDPSLGVAKAVLLLADAQPIPNVEITLPHAIELSGRVLDASGVAVVGAVVEAGGPLSRYGIPSATTDANGSFALGLEQAGSGSLDVSAPGFLSARMAVEISGPRHDVELRLDPAPSFRGVVLDAGTLQPVRRFTLRLTHSRPAELRRDPPDEVLPASSDDGSFSFVRSDGECFGVSVSASGYRTATFGTVDPALTDREPLRVLLERE